MRETRILLMRHAETAAPDRFHGAESDIELGEAGHRQAEAAGAFLASLPIDALFCSGMRRARQTAEAIGLRCGLAPEVVESLHERRIGPLSGKRREEVWGVYAEAKARWMAGELDYTHEGGESYADIRHRVVGPFRTLAERHPGRTVAVVAHGVVIRVLLTSLLDGHGPEHFGRVGIDFVALNDLRWDGERWRVLGWNATPWGESESLPA